MSPSYGHAYLTSYGWTGTGTGLRNGAIEKPLAIPQKKNLSGVGKDRDEAFPFWDHLFAAASKAITIKVSSDDEDGDETETLPSHTDPFIPLRRTTTGIISNQRPICGTSASTSGSTTPNLHSDAGVASVEAVSHLSLLATAKREAAKRGLYARFFRGPVLGPDDDHCAGAASYSAPSSDTASVSTSVSVHVSGRPGKVVGETKMDKKRKLEGGSESKEERRERKRLKRERKAARAAKKAEKVPVGGKAKGKKDRFDRKARGHWNKETQPEENKSVLRLEKARRRSRKSTVGSVGNLELAERTREGLKEKLVSIDGEKGTHLHRPSYNVDAGNAFDVGLSTKKEKGKRKDTPSDS